MSAIVRNILNETEEHSTQNDESSKQVPYLESRYLNQSRGLDIMDKLDHPRIFKTHLRYDFFEKKIKADKLKVILVVRNPKDVFSSFYHHYQQRFIGFKGTFHEFFKLVEQKRVIYGDYFDWLVNWWPNASLPNVLAIKYEEMQSNCADVVQRVAKFMGRELDDTAIQRVVEGSSFKNMRSSNAIVSSNSVNKDMFFRKGVVGDWKNHMNDEEVKYTDKMCERHLNPIGLVFDY